MFYLPAVIFDYEFQKCSMFKMDKFQSSTLVGGAKLGSMVKDYGLEKRAEGWI